MTKEIFIDTIKESFHTVLGDNQLSDVYDVLMAYRGISQEVEDYPIKVIKDIFVKESYSPISYYPCDFIELKHILKTNKIFNDKQLGLFSLSFAKKYLLDYSVFIGLEGYDKCDKLGGIIITENLIEDVLKNIKKIYIKSNSPVEKEISNINMMLKEMNCKVDICTLVDIPSLSEPKISNTKPFNLSKISQINNINFSQLEQNIFNVLVQCKQHFNLNVTMRICGGFVRDKLLGIPSDDIDITLDTMTGAKFVEYLTNYAQVLPEKNVIGKTYIVGQDIDKSKHLETAGIDIYGQKIEFVNLRSEEYGNSRIPTIKIGTPEQDAERRDLTLNALFYNIETGQIEDYVGGLKDLKTMTLRTPLDPAKTFQDDPLRMLRVLRFYSRYPQSQIDPAIIEAIKSPEVQSQFNKLSPERSSPELIKMMEGERPDAAARIMFETGLYKHVFQVPSNISDISMNQESPYHNLNLMEHTLSDMSSLNKRSKERNLPKEERGLLNLSAMLHDFGKMFPEIRTPRKDNRGYHYIGHENKSYEFVNQILTKMGFPQEAKEFVSQVVLKHMDAHNFNPNVGGYDKKMGRFLNQVDSLYENLLEHALADSTGRTMPPEEIKKEQQKYKGIINDMTKYRQEMGDMIKKPVIDGNRIREIFTEVVPEMVQENAFIKDKSNPKGKHYLAYVIEKLLEAQWSRVVKNTEEAEQFIRKNVKNWRGIWRQSQMDLPPKKSNNWYQTIKIADASSPENPDGGDGYEGSTPREQQDDIQFVQYSALSPLQKGDKVRLRTQAWSFDPPAGRVVNVANNIVTVEWETGKYKGRKTKHNLTDTVELSATLEKI
jgi:tRNA nucleotidyltransferase/poly(A) polymerase